MKRVIIFFLILVVFASCRQNDTDNQVVARVNQDILFSEDLKANFTEQQWTELSKKEKEELVQDWITLTILSLEADNLGISETPQIRNKIEIAEKNIKSNAVIAQKMAEIKLTEDELFNYYRVHKSQYQKSHKEYRVQRIFITDETLLEEVKTTIRDSSFKDAAIRYSQESIGKNGGYLGWVSSQNTQKNIWNTLLQLKIYHWTTIPADGGFYIIRYYDERTVSTDRTFVEVVDEIRTILLKQKRQETYENLIEELKKKSVIEISL